MTKQADAPALPKRLHKYMPCPHFVRNCFFRFSQPSALNDPREALPGLSFGRYAREDFERARAKANQDGLGDLSKDELEKFYLRPFPAARFDEKGFPGLGPARYPELRKEPFKSIDEFDRALADRAVTLCHETADRSIGIFSLTESSADTMWAYYANDHSGVAITFDTSHRFFSQSSHLFPVQYSAEPIYVSSNSGVVRIAGAKLGQGDILNGTIQYLPIELFLRKHSDWEHEQEWRMIRNLDEADETKQHESGCPICLFELPRDSIVGISIGYKASDEMIEIVKTTITRDFKWCHVKLTKRVRLPNGKIEEQSI